MSLNKEICKKCINSGDSCWGDDDEERWNAKDWEDIGGTVVCPDINIALFCSVSGNPPEHCPYLVEHMVSEEKKI